MSDEPFGGDVVKLKGTAAYRRRVGTYRILFTIHTEEIIILIIDVRKSDNRTYSDV